MTRIVRQNVYWKLEGKITRETEKAVCIVVKKLQGVEINSKAYEWFPRSQIENVCYAEEADSFEATQWILEQKGFSHDLSKIQETPQRVMRESIEVESDEYMPKESERRTIPFDEMDDDIPF